MRPVILLQLVLFFLSGSALTGQVLALESGPMFDSATNVATLPPPEYGETLRQAEIRENLKEEQQRLEKRLEVRRALPRFIEAANAEHLACSQVNTRADNRPFNGSPEDLRQQVLLGMAALLVLALVARRFSLANSDAGRLGPVEINADELEDVSKFTVALVHGLPVAESGSQLSAPDAGPPEPQAKIAPLPEPVYYKRAVSKDQNSSPEQKAFAETQASGEEAVRQKALEQSSPIESCKEKICVAELPCNARPPERQAKITPLPKPVYYKRAVPKNQNNSPEQKAFAETPASAEEAGWQKAFEEQNGPTDSLKDKVHDAQLPAVADDVEDLSKQINNKALSNVGSSGAFPG
ncbi:MAG TPA: hypothetical protein VFA77_17710 [Candidatus Eisenbacteria bacterium]|nr:hypothetical protein [Candidatus Eisenbacteria bacterium]